jgi:hypothetical protein
MSRAVARTTLADVLNGRHFQPDALTHIRRGDIAPLTPQRNWFDTSLLSATRRLAKEPSRDLTPVRQAAARLCGAAATMTDWRVDEHTRINAALAAGRVLGNDPISLLQLAAAQIGCFRDEQGAAKAVAALNGRWFAGKQVCADTLDEAAYAEMRATAAGAANGGGD